MSFGRQNLEAAAYVFEKSHGRQLEVSELSAIQDAGFAILSPDVIADMIWSALEEPQDSEYRIEAYWALGKLARMNDKLRFINALRIEIERDIQASYQIMIALDNMDEHIFSRPGVCCNEDTLNKMDALVYLERQK